MSLFFLIIMIAGLRPLPVNKIAFVNQQLVARKFSDKFSRQLMPAWIHYNVVPYGVNNSNEVFSMGLGAKYKATSKLNITFAPAS